jgi:hypothetical protein
MCHIIEGEPVHLSAVGRRPVGRHTDTAAGFLEPAARTIGGPSEFFVGAPPCLRSFVLGVPHRAIPFPGLK